MAIKKSGDDSTLARLSVGPAPRASRVTMVRQRASERSVQSDPDVYDAEIIGEADEPESQGIDYASSLLELGALAAQRGPGAGAQALFERAMEIARQRRSESLIASVEAALAELELANGNRVAVLRCLRNANHLLRRLGVDPSDQVTAASRLMRMMQNLQELEGASVPAPAGAASARQSARLEANAVLGRAPLESARPHPSRAAAAYEKHQADARKTGEHALVTRLSEYVPRKRDDEPK